MPKLDESLSDKNNVSSSIIFFVIIDELKKNLIKILTTRWFVLISLTISAYLSSLRFSLLKRCEIFSIMLLFNVSR